MNYELVLFDKDWFILGKLLKLNIWKLIKYDNNIFINIFIGIFYITSLIN
jgi:hypothetical protein